MDRDWFTGSRVWDFRIGTGWRLVVEVGKRKLVLQRISLSVIRRCDERSRADAAQLTVAMHQLGVKTIVARQK